MGRSSSSEEEEAEQSGWAKSSTSANPNNISNPQISNPTTVTNSNNKGKRQSNGRLGEAVGDVSLRQWLDKLDRPVDLVESLHIFRQIVEMVSAAHEQGIVVQNIRPSCFVMSTFNRVTFIESGSCSTSGSGSNNSSDEVASDGVDDAPPAGAFERPSKLESRLSDGNVDTKKIDNFNSNFPLRNILLVEFNWYISPEEGTGNAGSFASDVYRLGILLFELLCTFPSMEEKLRTMSNLRHRVLPPQLLLKCPKEASFCLWLLHPQTSSRPKISEVLKSEFLNEPRKNFNKHDAEIKLSEVIEEHEVLLEFLVTLQKQKSKSADLLLETISYLSSDIEEVLKKKTTFSPGLDKEEISAVERDSETSACPQRYDDSEISGSRKRLSQGQIAYNHVEANDHLAESLHSNANVKIMESITSKSSRLMKNFKKIESAYFLTRYRMNKPTVTVQNKSPSIGIGPGRSVSGVRTESSSVDNLAHKESLSLGKKSDWINPFLNGLCRYLCFSKFDERAHLKHGDLLNSSNLVCSLGFDRDKKLFATAGVNKKIKIFECDTILNEDSDIHYPVVEMGSRSKFSNICWNNYIKNQIASSDFEGVVQVWDVTRSQVVAEMREHERRVWSVDFSLADPTKLASGSDDCSVKLWNINQVGSIDTIKTKANVCSVQFSPDSGRMLAIGSADHRIYCYDLRTLRMPLCTLLGHTRTVSYVKFIDSSTLVSASTDNSIKLWDLSTSKSRVLNDPVQTFTGHTNVKNFVGLSISDGYIATGSETNEVFVYYKAFPMPVLSFKFECKDPITGALLDDSTQFISSVCWRGQSSTLVAADSSGNIKVLEMV